MNKDAWILLGVGAWLFSFKLDKLDRWIQHQGAISSLLSRFIPLISLIMVTMGKTFNILPWGAWLVRVVTIIGVTYGINFINQKTKGNNSWA